MRRTLHAGQLPSQTIIKRRRVDISESTLPGPTERGESEVAPTVASSSLPSKSESASVPPAHTLPQHVRSPQSSDDDEDDDEADLLREQQRLAKLKERNQSTAASTSGVASYNSDVLFRRTVPASARNNSAKAKFLRHSNLQASKDHRDFLMHYFR